MRIAPPFMDDHFLPVVNFMFEFSVSRSFLSVKLFLYFYFGVHAQFRIFHACLDKSLFGWYSRIKS